MKGMLGVQARLHPQSDSTVGIFYYDMLVRRT